LEKNGLHNNANSTVREIKEAHSYALRVAEITASEKSQLFGTET
jgi:hypothetical protein